MKSIRKIANNYFPNLDDNNLRDLLLKGSGGAFLINVVSAGVAFGVQILLARLLGANVYGDYTYVISWIAILTLFGKLGMDTASLRFVSEYNVQEKWDLLVGFLKRSIQLVSIISVCIAFLMGGVVLVLWDNLGGNLVFLFLLALVLLPLNSLLEVGGTFLRGFKHVAIAIIPRSILHPLFLALGAIITFWFFGAKANASLAIIINVVASFVTLLIIAYYLFRVVPRPARQSPPKYETGEWLNVALPLFLISGLHLILIRTDVLMVGALSGTTNAGIYSATTKITELMLFGQNSVMFIFAPMISEIYSKGEKKELQRMVSLVTKLIVGISLPIGIALLLLGNFLLSLFGKSFILGYPALGALIIGQMVVALLGTAGWLLSMTGHQKENAVVIGISVIINLVLNWLLIPYWGVLGAAVATVVSLFISNMVLAYLAWKRLDIIPTLNFKLGK